MSLALGDRVAVFTGRDYVTIANHGVMLIPSNKDQPQSIVFLPHLNSYCLADDEALLRCEPSPNNHVRFAEIVFDACAGDLWYGTYQRLAENRNSFRFIRSDEGFGFDLRAEIVANGMRLGKCHLEIRVPSTTQIDTMSCVDVLRQILRLEYAKYVEPKPKDVG